MINRYLGTNEWRVYKNTITHKRGHYFLVCMDENMIPESIMFARADLNEALKKEDFTFIKLDSLKMHHGYSLI